MRARVRLSSLPRLALVYLLLHLPLRVPQYDIMTSWPLAVGLLAALGYVRMVRRCHLSISWLSVLTVTLSPLYLSRNVIIFTWLLMFCVLVVIGCVRMIRHCRALLSVTSMPLIALLVLLPLFVPQVFIMVSWFAAVGLLGAYSCIYILRRCGALLSWAWLPLLAVWLLMPLYISHDLIMRSWFAFVGLLTVLGCVVTIRACKMLLLIVSRWVRYATKVLGKAEKAMFRAHSDACLPQSQVDPKLVEAMLNGELTDDVHLKKHVYCVLHKCKVISKDGKLQKTAILSKMSSRSDGKNATKILESCAEQSGDTPEDVAWNLFRCGYDKKAVLFDYMPTDSSVGEIENNSK